MAYFRIGDSKRYELKAIEGRRQYLKQRNSLAIRREKSAGGYGAVGDNCRINLGIQDYFSACIRGKKHGLDLGQIRTAGKGHH